ncbi:MAG: hypothetical protein ACQEQF_00250 [Bacillota bacterium]
MSYSEKYLNLKMRQFYESGEVSIRRSMNDLNKAFINWLERMEVNYDMEFDFDYNTYKIKEWE